MFFFLHELQDILLSGKLTQKILLILMTQIIILKCWGMFFETIVSDMDSILRNSRDQRAKSFCLSESVGATVVDAKYCGNVFAYCASICHR